MREVWFLTIGFSGSSKNRVNSAKWNLIYDILFVFTRNYVRSLHCFHITFQWISAILIWPFMVTQDKENGAKWNFIYYNFLYSLLQTFLFFHCFPDIYQNSPDIGLAEQRWSPCRQIVAELKPNWQTCPSKLTDMLSLLCAVIVQNLNKHSTVQYCFLRGMVGSVSESNTAACQAVILDFTRTFLWRA